MKIKQFREAKGLSMNQLAVKAGLNYRTIVAIENGGDVLVSTLKRIAVVLEVDIKELLE